jgi:hypothetical protein
VQLQGQSRNTGISPLRRQNAPPSVEMTFVRVKKGTGTTKTEADPYGMTNKRTSNRNVKGGLGGRVGWEAVWVEKRVSPLRSSQKARTAPVEMTMFGVGEQNKEATVRANATAEQDCKSKNNG